MPHNARLVFLVCFSLSLLTTATSFAAEPIDIGSRLELLVDDTLIESQSETARFELHHPTPREIVFNYDKPWEGTGCGYQSIFKDGDKYRMYYKAWNLDVQEKKLGPNHSNFTCYAESDDGIHWKRPNLGLFSFPPGSGNKQNNIVIGKAYRDWMKSAKPDPVHPAVFKDENPACPADAKYKAILRSRGPHGLLVLKSPDGIHWSLLSEKPVITDGAFDSENLAFWDPATRQYRAYWRYFTKGTTNEKNWKPSGLRDIRTATSDDLLTWSKPQDLKYGDAPPEQLYTNQIKPYYRAPHILVGFPTRYIERGWSKSMEALPELKHRKMRSSISNRYGMAITEGLFMTSRDGVNFKRWPEAFLRPGIERKDTWNYGHQYIAWQLVETKSDTEGAPNELSLYATEGYWTGKGSKLRRYTMRIDGFVSINAPLKGGEFTTKPITFTGKELKLNFSTSAAGGITVELQTPDGKPIEGFTDADCTELFGDTIARPVHWKQGTDVSSLAGQPVKLKIKLKDADLYSFKFE
ncbi:hypothetical protein Pan241w_22530 [Gimesia alba]|uniref:Glycosyl hydrolase family 32 N-terminal domain-containing protein n=1 Tax=Gimesia alba TaxID=2527973 RepID=A0A517RE64_9PLAN|nr:hypothetical protein Pan241w_22530 [Gimesia alba]